MIFDKLFGFSIKNKNSEEDSDSSSQTPSISKDQIDGSQVIVDNAIVTGNSIGWGVSFDPNTTNANQHQLISKYREISLIPEVEKAIDILVCEAINNQSESIVSVSLDKIDISDKLKDIIKEEFDYILNLLDFNNLAYDIFKRWYIDGRIFYQVIIDKNDFKTIGIKRLIYLDPRKVKKLKIANKKKDPTTGVELYDFKQSYFVYSEDGFQNDTSGVSSSSSGQTLKIAEDAIVTADSGLLDPTNTIILSYLHKAIRPVNQLKSLEDATMIYRISRAPERRVFYIDVGELSPSKAEQVLKKQMEQYKSKLVYDPHSGTVKSDPKQLTMIEDYWLPRSSNGRATEITTLPAGQLGGDLSELTYFINKLYNSLNVPITRLQPENGFTLGKSTEITRDEIILTKFVNRLQKRFSSLFLQLLKRQLTLKNIIDHQEFSEIQNKIIFKFDVDNHFNELVEAEIRDVRLSQLERVNQFRGDFFSKEYIYKNILKLNDQDIEHLEAQIKEEGHNNTTVPNIEE